MKYQNKDGITLNFAGDCSTSVLVREVISKAIKILKTDTAPYGFCDNTINFFLINVFLYYS